MSKQVNPIELTGISSLAFVYTGELKAKSLKLDLDNKGIYQGITRKGNSFFKDQQLLFALSVSPAKFPGFPHIIHIKFNQRAIAPKTFALLVDIAKKLDVTLYLRNFTVSPNLATRVAMLASSLGVRCLFDKQTLAAIAKSEYANTFKKIRQITSNPSGRNLLCAGFEEEHSKPPEQTSKKSINQ